MSAGDERWRCRTGRRYANAKVRVRALADQQFGRVAAWQLRAADIGRTTTQRWITDGYLIPELPRVYAVGHAAPSTPGALAAAVLDAGPGTMLSHATAAWWSGFIAERPHMLDVSPPHRTASIGDIKVHARRDLRRTWRAGLPLTDPHQTLLDLTASAPRDIVRHALASAEFANVTDLGAARGRGRLGSADLGRAIKHHEPRLARTRSELERAFLRLCERHAIPLPDVNVPFAGFTIDALWPDRNLAVELDGYDNHSTPAQIASDHRRDLALRSAGFMVVRYSWDQITRQPELVAADLWRLLALSG